MSRVKNQHKVPKCYLKKFTIDNISEGIWLFDKNLIKKSQTNIRDVATSRYFYDIPEGYLGEGGDQQAIEKILSTIECEYSQYLTKLINNLSATFMLANRKIQIKYYLTDIFKAKMSFFLALQLARTEEFRRMFDDVNIGILEKLSNEMLAEDLKTGKAPKELIGESIKAKLINGHEVIEHIKMLGDESFLSTLQDMIKFGYLG